MTLQLALASFLLITARPNAVDDPSVALRTYLDACERFGFSGSVLVTRKGKTLLAEGYGLADRERRIENAPETCFEIASCTKSFTAVAILQLAEQKKLDLDDSIAEHLPGVPESMRKITVRHLLNHTSGMPRTAPTGSGDDLEAAVAGYLSSPRVREPGASHEYWNGGYALLAGIVERASGTTYMQWCHEHLFEPAGMKSSGFTGEELFAKLPVAIGYETDEEPRRADEHPYQSYGWNYRGMGGIVTNVEDMLRFHAALRGDALLSDRSRRMAFTAGPGKYGLGFYVLDEPRPIVTHGGDVRGFHSRFELYPKEDAAIVVLCNSNEAPTWAVIENLRSILFGDRSRYPFPPETEAWKPGELEQLAGTWTDGEGGIVEAEADGDVLVLHAASVEATRLLWRPSFGPPTRGAGSAAPAPELVMLAQELVEAVARHDPEPLRPVLGPHIPSSWPDRLVSSIWPERMSDRGELRSMRVAGGLADSGSTTVLLALEHERGSSRVKIVFQGEKLSIFDLNGPRSLASRRVLRAPKDRLVGYAWTGAQPPPIEILRDAKKEPRGLKIAGPEGSREYERSAD